MAIPLELRLQTVETNSEKNPTTNACRKSWFCYSNWSFLSKTGISEISKPHERSIESDVTPAQP